MITTGRVISCLGFIELEQWVSVEFRIFTSYNPIQWIEIKLIVACNINLLFLNTGPATSVFSSWRRFKWHRKRKHGEKDTFPRELCDYKTDRKDILPRHKKYSMTNGTPVFFI